MKVARLLAVFALLSCNANSIGFEVVSIRPIYGWVDGCNAVKVSGHGFEEGASVRVGGAELSDLTAPELATDKGYQLFGTMPAGEHGYADVVVTQPDGDASTLANGYYFVECPGAPYVESVSEGVVAGDAVTLSGCGFDATNMFVQVEDGPSLPLTAGCGTATATFEAPDLPPDTVVSFKVVDADGNDLYPGCSDAGGDTDAGDTDAADTDVDTDGLDTDADTDIPVDTDIPCEYPTLTYGGAE